MRNLEDHEKTKEALLDWYDRVIANGTLLGLDEERNGSGIAALREGMDALRAERFIVAVCGQMNAGKSTLLNALLFQDEILPASPTTMTAKIALLDGGEEATVEATLYSQEEFDIVVSQSSKDENAWRELESARELARENGLQERSLLRHPPQVERREDLKQILEFVAVPDEGGLYTPYVKSVRVRADIPWLHKITVADTPGTNDPNPERDKLTRDWIRRADAVVYVTYAGQAGMTAEDVRFIDENLLHVDAERRIIAVNKCDSVSDTATIRAYLSGLRTGNSIRMKELFKDPGSIVLVSGLGALIEGRESKGLPLSEGLSEWRPILAARGALNPEKHAVGELRSLIEDRIIRGRGEAVLGAHRAKIDAVFERIEIRLNRELAEWEGQVAAITAAAEGRGQSRQNITQELESLDVLSKEIRGKIFKFFERRWVATASKLEKIGRSCVGEFNKSLRESHAGIDQIAGHVSWVLRRSMSSAEANKYTQECLDEVIDDIEKLLNGAESELSDRLLHQGFGKGKVRQHLLELSVRSIVGNLLRDLPKLVDVAEIHEAVRVSVGRFATFFNTEEGRRKAVEEIEKEVGPGIDDCFKELSERSRGLLKAEVENVWKTMAENVKEILLKRLNLLDEIERDLESCKIELRQIAESCANHNARLAEVGALRGQFREATK